MPPAEPQSCIRRSTMSSDGQTTTRSLLVFAAGATIGGALAFGAAYGLVRHYVSLDGGQLYPSSRPARRWVDCLIGWLLRAEGIPWLHRVTHHQR